MDASPARFATNAESCSVGFVSRGAANRKCTALVVASQRGKTVRIQSETKNLQTQKAPLSYLGTRRPFQDSRCTLYCQRVLFRRRQSSHRAMEARWQSKRYQKGFVYLDGDKWKGRHREDLITGRELNAFGGKSFLAANVHVRLAPIR